jgi:hypothetical protein
MASSAHSRQKLRGAVVRFLTDTMRRTLKAMCMAVVLSLALATVAAASPHTRARVTLRVAPKYASGQWNFGFSVRLLGGHIPRGGKKLVLQARQGRGRWREFSVIRIGRDGRFHASYALRFLGPGGWEVRVLCEAEAGWPFATGTSNVVRVRVE